MQSSKGFLLADLGHEEFFKFNRGRGKALKANLLRIKEVNEEVAKIGVKTSFYLAF